METNAMRRRPHRMIVYEVDGDEYIGIATGGNSIQRSAPGDAIWAFSLKYQVGPAWWPPRPPPTNAGPGTWWGVRSAFSPYVTATGMRIISESRARRVIEEIEEIDDKIEVFPRCEALSARNSLRGEGVLPSSALALHPSWCVLARWRASARSSPRVALLKRPWGLGWCRRELRLKAVQRSDARRPGRGRVDAHRWDATVPKVWERLRETLTAFKAKNEPITINDAIRPYSIAVTPDSSFISLVIRIAIGGFPLGSLMPSVRSKA